MTPPESRSGLSSRSSSIYLGGRLFDAGFSLIQAMFLQEVLDSYVRIKARDSSKGFEIQE